MASVLEASSARTTLEVRQPNPLTAWIPLGSVVAILTAWHGVLAAAGAGVVAAALLLGTFGSGPAAIGVAVTGAVVAIASAGAIPLLRRADHRGRMTSLVLTYLVLVVAAFAMLQATGFFRGLDAVGENVGRAVPAILVVVVGWVVAGADRLPEQVQRAGRWLTLAGVAATLLLIGLLPGLLEFAVRLARPEAAAAAVVVVVSALLVHRTWQIDVARHFGATADQLELLDGLLFLSPNLIGFLVFFAGPLLFSLVISFFAWDALGDRDFIGLDNYTRIFALDITTTPSFEPGHREALKFGPVYVGARDPLFWGSLYNVIKFTVLALPAAVVPAIFLALALDTDLPGIKVFRAIFFVPSVAGVVAVALIWKQLLNATTGYVNFISQLVAGWLSALPGIDVAGPETQWLSDADVALYSLVIVFAWQYVGFNTVLFLAGLQGIDRQLYEAAAIDGAGWWSKFRHITLPQLAPTTFFVIATTGILTLQLFGEAVVLFPANQPIGSGPANSTLTPVVYLYDQGFRRFAQGYASAVAWVLFGLIFLFTYVQFRRQREEANV